MFVLLGLFFFATAALYASVGFGGGSTYNALLVVGDIDYRVIPVVALACNIIVVSGNGLRYWRAGFLNLSALLPLVLTSVPLAWIGGRIPVSATLFTALLSAALFATGVIMLLQPPRDDVAPPLPRARRSGAAMMFGLSIIGGGAGLLAGIVGIGGGIFLAPFLYAVRWGSAKAIAAACSLFILVNSLAGLTGQLTKHAASDILPLALSYWPLLPAVAIGGAIGNAFGVFRLRAHIIRRATATLILLVALRLAIRLL